MQVQGFCYRIEHNNKSVVQIKLQPDLMNGGYLPKPDDTLYEYPSTTELADHETLIISDGQWIKTPWYIGTKLYHKLYKTEICISEIGESPSDYPEYTDVAIPEPDYAYYYDYSASGWIFNLTKYKAEVCKKITALCVNENYTMFPQYKRDNVYSGSPVTDTYPDYLKGDTGKQSIARLNSIYQQIAANAQASINSTDIINREEVDAIISAIVFPTEAEILARIQS